MATSASGRHSPPWGKLEGCTAGHESFDVYTSARRRGGWWVHVWSALTHTRWPPWHPNSAPSHKVNDISFLLAVARSLLSFSVSYFETHSASARCYATHSELPPCAARGPA